MITDSSQPNNNSTAANPVGRFMVAAGAVIEQKNTGRILLVRRAATQDWQPNEWEITYGRIDQGEDVEQGLRREVREELGLTDVTIVQPMTCWHMFRGPEKPENELIGFTYYCTTKSEKPVLSHEHSEYRWVTVEEALQLVKVEGIKRDVLKYQELKKLAFKAVVVGKECVGVGAGALIFNEEGKLLLSLRGPEAKNEKGLWEIPGGAIEFGETLAQGLKREIKEELDIEVEIIEMLQVCDHILPQEHQHWVSPTYICKIVKGEPKIMEPEKCDRIDWFTLEEAEKLPLSLVTKEDIAILRNRNLA